jgi:hypothetical protein
MRLSRTVLIGITVGILSYALLHAQSHQRTPRFAAEDYVEIQQLYYGYAKGVDEGPEDASWTYTADGSYHSGDRTVSGQAALKQMYSNIRRDNVRHMRRLVSNLIVTPTANGATGSAYMFTFDGRDGTQAARVWMFGKYEDVLVKTRDGWRFKERHFLYDLDARAQNQPPK